jgi:acylphosphatase
VNQLSASQLSPSRLHAFVEGRVQGVGFRAFVIDCAARLDLVGWVRNTWQGEVEVVAEGPRQDLESLVDMLRKGPPSSFVTQIRKEWLPYSGEFSQFQVRLSG